MTIILTPKILVVVCTIGLALVLLKLPLVICGKLRLAKWFFPIAIVYHPLLIAAAYFLIGAEAAVGVLIFVLCDWLMPMTYLFSSGRRRAFYRAVDFQEREGECGVNLFESHIFASENDRFIIKLFLLDGSRPACSRHFFVSKGDFAIEDADYDYMREKYAYGRNRFA